MGMVLGAVMTILLSCDYTSLQFRPPLISPLHYQMLVVCPQAPVDMGGGACWFPLEVPRLFAAVLRGTLGSVSMPGLVQASR